jgi:hypothetical protein
MAGCQATTIRPNLDATVNRIGQNNLPYALSDWR